MEQIIKPQIALKPQGFFRNGHFQTIYSSLFHKPTKNFDSDSIIIKLDEVNSVKCFHTHKHSNICVILVHGLEGSSESSYVLSTAKKLINKGFSVVRMNLRNCGDTLELCETLYNAGLGNDVLKVAEHLHTKFGYKKIFTVGYSLGANTVLKMAGEMKKEYHNFISGVCAISPPLDLTQSSEAISKISNKIYDNHYLKRLIKTYIKKHKLYPKKYPLDVLKKIKNLKDFDNLITGPSFGYIDGQDYYVKNSSLAFIKDIDINTLIIQSKDDPIIPFDSTLRALNIKNHKVKYMISEHGGHVGFINSYPESFKDIDSFWAENRIVDFVFESL